MEVKSSFSETESRDQGSFENKLGAGSLSVSIKEADSYSSHDSSSHDMHYEKSNSAKYTVNVHVGQFPILDRFFKDFMNLYPGAFFSAS